MSNRKLGQYLNLDAIRDVIKYSLNPRMFKPHYSVRSVSDISFAALKDNGIEVVVFDKDNTLTVPY